MRKLKTLLILIYHKPTGNPHIVRIYRTAVADRNIHVLNTQKYKGT
jgi:hypothetical protein